MIYNNCYRSKDMSNNLQTNLGYFIMNIYDTYGSFSLCHLANIFFHKFVRAKELSTKQGKQHVARNSRNFGRNIATMRSPLKCFFRLK